LLIISGDEAAADPAVRAMAAAADAVIGIGLFEDSFRGLADLVLPGTSYLERDGTTVNLEGRLQRQRRAVLAPCPDELAWISSLAKRFDIELSPHAALVFDEVSAACFGGIGFGDVGEHSELPAPTRAATSSAPPAPAGAASGTGLRLVAYKPLFSGTAVERTPELQFQRPAAEVELSRADARARGLRNGAPVTVSSNGTSVELRARIARDLAPGTVRVAEEHAGDLHPVVDVKPAEVGA
jgi:predicted molibdopterin-dependent oxidoreductase YjgC